MYLFLMPQCKLVEIDNKHLQGRIGSLNAYLAKHYNLPQDQQVLLTNGGYQLRELNDIEKNSAGENTTNPIYVFLRGNKIAPEACPLKALSIPSSLLEFLQNPTGATLDLLPQYLDALVVALKEDVETIGRLDQEQRFMCQGWFVARANFEQLLKETRETLDDYWKDYAIYCSQVRRWEANLSRFPSIKERLRSVPLLPSLLPASAELAGDSNGIHGPPLNLYDWICLQMARAPPRRLTAPSFSVAGNGGFRLLSTHNSSLDISLASSRVAASPNSKFIPASSVPTFYLPVTTSSSPSAPPPDQGDAEGFAGVVASLETPLVELVENSAAWLKVIQDRPLASPPPAAEDVDNNSLLLVGEEEAEVADSPTEPQLSQLFAILKGFGSLLDSAPRETETPADEEDEEREVALRGGSNRILAPPASAAITISPSLALSSDYSWPLPEEEEEEEEEQGGAQAEASPTAAALTSLAKAALASSSPKRSTSPQASWAVSTRDFSRHLESLSKLKELAEQKQQTIAHLARRIFVDFPTKRAERRTSELLKSQAQNLLAVNTTFKAFTEAFAKVSQLKSQLANAIWAMQEKMQVFSSEVNTKDRMCVRCFKKLEEISKCSALLDQLQDTSELYIKCLLEIVRCRRMTALWNNLNDRHNRRLADFQCAESRRREVLAQALKDHLLTEIFRPFHLHFRPPRQCSRVSITSAANMTSSIKRLTTASKCLSTSQINFQPPSSAFRLASNRPPEARLRPSAFELVERSGALAAVSVPTVSDEEVHELATRLPADLADMVSEALAELEAEEKRLMAGLSPDASEAEGGEEAGPPSTRGRRSRPASLSGVFSFSPSHSQHCGSVDVATNTVERLATFPTADKAVSVAMVGGGAQDSFCDSPFPPPAPPPPLPPPPPLLLHHRDPHRLSLSSAPGEGRRADLPLTLSQMPSDIFLSMDASQFDERSTPAALSVHSSPSQQFHSAFYSLQGSERSGTASAGSANSLVAPPDSRICEALRNHNDCLRRLCDLLTCHLRLPLAVEVPRVTGAEEVGTYLNETAACLSQLVSQFEALEADLIASACPKAVESVAVQSFYSTFDVATECRPRDFGYPQTSPAFAAVSTPTHGADSSLALLPPRDAAIRISRQECVFLNFRPGDVVIFIPIVCRERPGQQQARSDFPLDGETPAGAESSGLWGSGSLALLSSAIISSSLAPEPSQTETSSVEQWRMLSNDGHVYFLHNDDFDAFNVARLACLSANSAHSRDRNGASSSPGLSNTVLPLSRRALPYAIGVFQRKEKCISRKEENRFSLPRNFVFFRVRARPL